VPAVKLVGGSIRTTLTPPGTSSAARFSMSVSLRWNLFIAFQVIAWMRRMFASASISRGASTYSWESSLMMSVPPGREALAVGERDLGPPADPRDQVQRDERLPDPGPPGHDRDEPLGDPVLHQPVHFQRRDVREADGQRLGPVGGGSRRGPRPCPHPAA
jgi:hypothetical protein